MENMVRCSLSQEELDLINDIEEIGFGELKDVRDHARPPIAAINIPSAFATFIHELRENKQFDKVIIHEGQPKSAEVVSRTSRGRSFTKKLRF